ncbi:AIR synthase-related protein, partial [Pseudomonas helleri]|uniref:AIR synthase-related protein n=1 Tax=Pseudomonas helleri TaxID=1608996 RepID=UPI003FD027C3
GTAPQVIGAAWGTVEKGAAYGRESARPGDYLFIAGQLGAFSGALALMDATISEDEIPSHWREPLEDPMARVAEGRYMRNSGKIAAACDLSDGLTEAINIFCADGVGITLSEDELPLHPIALEASQICSVPSWKFAFGVGDWAIAFVVRESDAHAFREELDDELEFFEIGRFDFTGQKLISDRNGITRKVPDIINEHFRQRAEDDGIYQKKLLHKP